MPAVLAALGVVLLVTAVALVVDRSGSPPPPPGAAGPRVPGASALDPAPTREATSTAGPVGPTGGTTAPPAQRGRPLPAQWPEIRPTTLTLLSGTGGPTAPVDPVRVVGRSLSLPDDPDRVGWWQAGARAGAPFGTILLAGHLDSVEDPVGFLAGLAALRPGDLVEVSAGSSRQAYRVSRNYLLPSADLSRRSDLFDQQRPHRLLLITCGGPYDRELGRYRDNRVVEAEPVTG